MDLPIYKVVPLKLYNSIFNKEGELRQAPPSNQILSNLFNGLSEDEKKQADEISRVLRARLNMTWNERGEITSEDKPFNIWNFILYCVKGEPAADNLWRDFTNLISRARIPRRLLSKTAKLDLRFIK